MILRNRHSLIFLGILTTFSYLAPFATAQAQDSTIQYQKAKSPQVEYFYIHGALGLCFDIYKSSDIEALVSDELNVHALGFPFQYGIRGGFRNIAQFEYYSFTTSAHNIGTGGFVNGEIVSTSVPMKLKVSNILLKINPFIWSWVKSTRGKPANSLFLIVGNGNASYRDKVGDGFTDGAGPIYGLEWAVISKYASFSFGATSQKITYDTVRLFDIDVPYKVKASHFMMYVRMGLGYGM